MRDKDLIDKATEVVRQHNRVDVILLMRELQIRYAQAARLLSILEKRGVVAVPIPPPLPPIRKLNNDVPIYILHDAAIGIAYMHGSISYARLQHDLEISYPVAARLMDMLEESNIIKRDGDKIRWTLNDAWQGVGEEDIRRGSETYNDSLMDQARQLVIFTGIETAAFLAERLNIGYARAGRILDGLEAEGTIAESPTWIYEEWRNIYLNIDGVLLTDDKQPAPHVYEFIKRLTIRHPVYWLTMHCKKEGDDPLKTLGSLFDDKTTHYLKCVKPAYWQQHKTEAIDFSKPFLWFDDDVSETDRAVLKQHSMEDSLVEVDLAEDLNCLASLSEIIQKDD